MYPVRKKNIQNILHQISRKFFERFLSRRAVGRIGSLGQSEPPTPAFQGAHRFAEVVEIKGCDERIMP
jgi:hypothetical protein